MTMQGIYYVGRVLKLGILDQKMLIDAVLKPAFVNKRGNAWTFIDISELDGNNGNKFLFGRLIKYSPNGEVSVVDESTRAEITQLEPNLVIASSPFIYIPEHSGIAFLNVSGQIEQQTFMKRFSEIITKTYDGFFVECGVELITDYKTFTRKLEAIETIIKIEAKVSPPNPLFSPLWEDLEKYLRARNADVLTLKEESAENSELNTYIKNAVHDISIQNEDEQFKPNYPMSLIDSAILMAADGYGSGVIVGKTNSEHIVIKTCETSVNFSFDKVPNPYELYVKALEIFDRIQKDRHMKHADLQVGDYGEEI